MIKPKAINCITQLVAFVLLIIPKGVVKLKEYEKLDKAIAEAERTKRQLKYYADKVEYSCDSKSQICKFGNQGSGTRKSLFCA